MTRLVDTLEALGLTGEITNGGRWVCLPGERCRVYVVETSSGSGYFTWCGAPCEGVVAFYRDANTAIQAGLARAEARASGETEHRPGGRDESVAGDGEAGWITREQTRCPRP